MERLAKVSYASPMEKLAKYGYVCRESETVTCPCRKYGGFISLYMYRRSMGFSLTRVPLPILRNRSPVILLWRDG